MTLDEHTMRLIAVGASITANCQPCLQTNVTKAQEEGITNHDVARAIEIGTMVRVCAASGMDQFASSLGAASTIIKDCGCK